MVHYKTISEWFQAWQLPNPEHPLISVVKVDIARMMRSGDTVTCFCDFYCIAIKRVTGAEDLKLKYGQQPFDFNEGIMAFVSPGQVTSLAVEKDIEVKQSGWHLIVHPDFLWNTPLANTIKRYEFWDYAANESLFLSDNEEEIIISILQNIHRETHANIDKFSKRIIISQLESLLNYAERFYEKLIERAKERISTSDLSMSEIAYELGFEHLQSFSRLFKAKTQLSPVEFRRSFKN
jgi:Helix-turn-helix domain